MVRREPALLTLGRVAVSSPRASWPSLRYGALLAAAGSSRRLGDLYARLCAAVEWRLDPARRDAALVRIERWLRVDRTRAAAIFRDTLRSEAREEADVRWLMDHPAALASVFRAPADEPRDLSRCIWATMHLGSPNLAFVWLRCIRGVDVRIVGRPLDDANPMPAAKRAWGVRKVQWLETVTGAPFLGVDAEATAAGRAHVLQGGALMALIDTPGDIVSRAMDVDLFGERVRLASGMFVLAGLLGVPVRPIVAVSRGGSIHLRLGSPIAPPARGLPGDAVAREIAATLRDLPGEWWLWPYVPRAA